MQFNAGLKLMMAICTIFGCLGQIWMSGQDIKDASKELKEQANVKEANSESTSNEV